MTRGLKSPKMNKWRHTASVNAGCDTHATFGATTATVAQAETYTVTSGSLSASYAVTAGEFGERAPRAEGRLGLPLRLHPV